jgi:hypothetical protein
VVKKKNVFAICLLAVALVGCEKVDKALGRDPPAVLEQVRQYQAMADHDAVIKLATSFGEKSGPLQGEFALELAKAYAAKNDVDNAVRSLRTAMRLGVIASTDAMVDDSFSNINTELQFVSAIAEN